MHWHDLLRFAVQAMTAYRLRSFLTLSGIAVGIAAVILLTSIGEGIHDYVLNEFTKFGTNTITVTPGRRSARGGPPGVPTTARDLTLDDAEALARIPYIGISNPEMPGNAEVRGNGRVRRTRVQGVGPRMHDLYSFKIASGQFLPEGESRDARTLAVLGYTLKKELFGAADVLGERITIGGERYVVIGVLEPKGQILGIDIDDTVYIPAMRAMTLYNRTSLEKISVNYDISVDSARVLSLIRQTLTARHGREDFTLTTQEEMLARLLSILGIITLSIGGLGGISLIVGAVGIITIMTIAVTERTREIGLLMALGARRNTILTLFLIEAVALAAIGGLLGLSVGIGLARLVGFFAPSFPITTPWSFTIAAEIFSALIGLAAGVLPARQAARLNAVDALRSE
ncbi:MAG: ABC transporter permease [Azoarcus sp.]|jgi:putative ABC transport system permease protein|nr:ABC transporter permease [Azoarcus sp.]